MDQVWELVYQSFESAGGSILKTLTTSHAMRNEIQFRLQRLVGEYKATPSEELINAIEADINLGMTLGYITRETTDRILDILYKLKEN